MLTVKDVVKGIADTVKEQYPEAEVYLHGMPGVITAPSFDVYIDSDRSEDDNRVQTVETVCVGIDYYPSEQAGQQEGIKPLDVYSSLKSVFRNGFVRIGGRALKVVLLRGGRRDGVTFLIVKLVFCDYRPVDIYDRPIGEEAHPKMNKINLKVNQEG
ncbi:hypothetical protein DFR58_11878 [Anaerobacterium chartisolvens]|uniref:Gp37 protein n=1 Tax=Anaerobacterium chartisolvens TaxID=1297424 RepID=A0A369AV54_9FIRM|nr:hypothetical protein [Anaerobacterium chartisolvens]RCX13260.1 hypothetical protein DFR58_11878 [Anaerobacterium chartisolvens]